MRSTLSNVLLAIVAGASIATAGPVVRIRENPTFNLDFVMQVNHSGMRAADYDRLRVSAKLSNFRDLSERSDRYGGHHPYNPKHKQRRAAAIEASNTAVTYVASVGVGSPATQYSLVVDTGSSNTWIGADKSYNATSTSVDLHQNVSVSYGTGSFSGKECEYLLFLLAIVGTVLIDISLCIDNDTVTLSSDLIIEQQSIGVATTSRGFDGYDGILGLGPAELTENTVTGTDEVRTVSDNLLSQGKISTEVLGVSFAPTTTAPNTNGVLTFGGVDTSKYTGEITYVPVTTEEPASHYWGIDQSLTYGDQKAAVLNKTSGIVDTGSTLLLISQDAFERYCNLTNATEDSYTGLLKISDADYEKLESLYFGIGNTTFELTKNAQRLPQAFNELIGGNQNEIYLTIGSVSILFLQT